MSWSDSCAIATRGAGESRRFTATLAPAPVTTVLGDIKSWPECDLPSLGVGTFATAAACEGRAAAVAGERSFRPSSLKDGDFSFSGDTATRLVSRRWV